MRVIFISVLVIIIDQVSKVLVKGFKIPLLHINYQGMEQGQRIPIIGEFFRLTYIENPGMAFGYDPGMDYKFYLSLFSLLATVGLFIYLYYSRKQSRSLKVALAFILGGAAGNLIDRLFYGVFYGYAPLFHGKVVDFLDFDFINVNILGRSYDRFPIFNIADAAVTIGVLVLIIFYKSHSYQKDNAETETAAADNTAELNTSEITEDNSVNAAEENNINGEVPEQKKDADGESDNRKEASV